jgi:2-polyprenyl-3-methyl-5-hydroxy-6-metoxy-1,4-benzoquinol methylase
MNSRIIEHYNNYDEENRLVKDNAHRIEFITNIHYIEECCPRNSVILDACAGTGRYAFYLAEHGYNVYAGDIVPSHVEAVRLKNRENAVLKDIKINDVLNMDFPNNNFDVVLCMGALYHLGTEEERDKAIKECIRITKPNGIIILSYINKYAQMLLASKNGGNHFKDAYNYYKGESDDIFIGLTPEKIRELTERHNLKELKNISSEGTAYLLMEEINNATEEEFEIWMKYHFETCEIKSIIGNSLHGLYIGKKL